MTVDNKTKILRCDFCNKPAAWMYIDDTLYCDKHVPKGCSCQDDKKLPCCEYTKIDAKEDYDMFISEEPCFELIVTDDKLTPRKEFFK